jgi:hypothetical protein
MGVLVESDLSMMRIVGANAASALQEGVICERLLNRPSTGSAALVGRWDLNGSPVAWKTCYLA